MSDTPYPANHADQEALLVKALSLAEQAHRGQQDKYGMPYFGHVSRVVANCATAFDKTCAALHDVVEDTSVSLDHLREQGIPSRVVAVVDTLTRRAGETYDDYLRRVEADPRAWRIKLADLTDNMDLRRVPQLADEVEVRLRRYHSAYRRIATLISAHS